MDFKENKEEGFHHLSVMLEECIEGLNISPNGIYVDGTAGGAGHSVEIAKKLDDGLLIAIDKDKTAVGVAAERLSGYPAKVVNGDFRNIPEILDELGIQKVDGILLDLGVSSYQLDTPERGFSYRYDAPLDMRMSQDGISAYDVVNTYSVEELTRVFRDYGEERFAYRIANEIANAREESPVETTFQLVELIKQGIPAATRRTGGHPAKRVFQAIRIEVNQELESLKQVLENSFERLNVGGRFVILTFHSLEDRIVKYSFNDFAKGCECPPQFPICVCGKTPRAERITRKAIKASKEELEVNNRSRSASLRIIEKLREGGDQDSESL